MNSKLYWQKRAEQRILDAEKQSLRYENRIKDYFKQAEKDIESKISSLYMRYAKDNEMSYAESLKYLTNKQLKEFKKDLDFYIKSAKNSEYRKEFREYLQALSTRARVKRLEEFKLHLHYIAENTFSNVNDGVFELYEDVLNDTYNKTIFDIQQFNGFGKSFKNLPKNTLQSLLQYPWSGSDFSVKLWGNIDSFENKLDLVLTQGMIQGKSNRNIAKDLVEITGQARQKAIRLVRTETNYICNQSTKIAYVNYGVQEYEYLATLDSRTSEKCRNLDTKHWPIDKAIPGKNYPPVHAYCRSTTIPYFADNEGTRIAKDDATGKSYKVPASMSYEQWKKEHLGTE